VFTLQLNIVISQTEELCHIMAISTVAEHN